MNRRASLFVCIAGFTIAACGESTPPSTPPPATTSTVTIPIDAGVTPPPTASTIATAPDAGTISPDTTNPQSDAECGGASIDLVAVLANRRCRPGRDAPAAPASASTDVKVTLTPSATKVAPGGHLDFTLEVTNTGSSTIPLYFSGDLTLMPEVKDAKGTIVAPPQGNAPKVVNPACMQRDCRLPASHIVLAPGAKAHAQVGFDAVNVAWPAVGPSTCCVVHVDPVAKGSLAAGTYKVKIPLPYESNQGNPSDPEVTIRVGK